jgi:hypothetical protein
MSQDLVFEFNYDMSYDWNFDKWYRWNCREKRNYKEKEYTREEGRAVFDKIYPTAKVITAGQ